MVVWSIFLSLRRKFSIKCLLRPGFSKAIKELVNKIRGRSAIFNFAESNDLHSGVDKASPEKSKKRRLKTPSQVEALEKFYNEHKYPSESMRAQVALEIGLSEKQISGWFCHRRLKDKKLLKEESYVNGKQDISNGVMPDHGSGLRQDSCGSTKPGEYRHLDTREVESRRFYTQDYPAAVLAHESRSQHINGGDYDAADDTSSGSSAASQGRLLPLRYSSRDNSSTLMNAEGVKGRGYMMASRYLYLQDEIENPAISAVKRQLGRHYREDGPPVGVEFQPLPPGAFDSPIGDSVHEPYYVGDPILQSSRSTRVSKETNAHDRYKYETHPRGPYEGAGSRRTAGCMDLQDKFASYPLARRSSISSYGDHAPDRNSAMEMDDDSVKEASEFSTKNYGTLLKYKVEGRSVSSKDRRLHLYEGNVIAKESTYPRVQNDDTGSAFHRNEYFEAEATDSVLRHYASLDAEDRLQSKKMTKVKKLFKERKTNKDDENPVRLKTLVKSETKMGKKIKGNKLQGQNYASTLASAQELPWTKPVKRAASEMPTSFSDDETTGTGSSMD
ncbi:homeobox-DDT domain protein RLT2 isoform X2 [Magnolia sinica]|uniref:homeobox-DDT domain protein RLT2 isoform X2 n=1 Tax=Magnolia sinica TaxID=86752 RepID=UPI002658DE06|nr:homeobox-DDT domain protein RLT2 isoform X2 [Magnolia sinica]